MKNGHSGLARKLSEDVVPEEIGRRLKDTDVYDDENECVVMSCPFRREAFIRRYNRAVICGKPECHKARKAMNKQNSRKSRKSLHNRVNKNNRRSYKIK